MLAVLSILIIVHECGHFSVARLFGFQTPVFGFGLPFGPHWVVGKKWGTEFRIHAFLMGGYVAIPELGDESNADAFNVPLKPFRKFPIWQRALVAFAGVGFNMIFAYLIMAFMVFTIGAPDQITSISGLPKENPIAANAGVKVDDDIIKVDDHTIESPDDLVQYIGAHKKIPVTLHLMRGTQPVDIQVTPNEDGKVGMALFPKSFINKNVPGGFFDKLWLAAIRLWQLTKSMLDALGQMFVSLVTAPFHHGKATPGHPQIGFQDLHGVFAVIYIGKDIVQQDWSKVLIFTILISMDLAIINLVPWPGLDGAHLAFMLFEGLRGKPIEERAHGEIVKWGFISLLVLMVVIMFNDITAIVTGKLDFKKDKDKDQKQSQPATSTATSTGTSSSTTTGSSGSAETGTKTSTGTAPVT
ncbi:MAG: M50 family metallopeptidase, partial [Terriglobales bacterium]